MTTHSTSHDKLMMANIALAVIHIILSGVFFYLHVNKVEMHPYAFPAFFIISIIACIVMIVLSYLCKTIVDKEHAKK